MTLTTRYEISAQAGGDLVSFDIGAGTVLGQIVPMLTVYDYGNVGSGNDAGLQPAGNPGFDSGCYRLVGSDITAVTGLTGITTADDNLLYKTGVASGGGTNRLTVTYYFLVVCANGQPTTLNPWADMVSGTQQKYTGNFDKPCASTPCERTTPDVPSNPLTGISKGVFSSTSPYPPISSLPTGGTVIYKVLIPNSSVSYDSYVEKITDVLPAGTTFGTLVNGVSCANGAANTVEVTAAKTASIDWNVGTHTVVFNAVPGTIVPPNITGEYKIPAGNTLYLCYTATIPNTVGAYTNSATASVGNVTLGPVTTTVSVGTPPTVSKSFTPDTILAGGTSKLRVTLSNANGSNLTGTTFTDTLPSGLSYSSLFFNTCGGSVTNGTSLGNDYFTLSGGTIPAGGSCYVEVNVTSTIGGSYPNTIPIGAVTTTQDLSNTSAANATLTVTPVADLSLAKIVNNGTPNVGSNVTFTVTVSNAGPSNASGVTVGDLLPDGYSYVSSIPSQGSYVSGTGVWTVGTIASGSSANIQITATVLASGTYTNTAQVTASDQTDPELHAE